MQKRPFDLSQAMAGKTVIDGSGRKGKYIYSLSNPTFAYGNKIHIFSFKTDRGEEFLINSDDNGNAVLTKEFIYTGILSIEVEEKEFWVATGISKITSHLYTSQPFTTADDAALDLRNRIELIETSLQTHKIIRYE